MDGLLFTATAAPIRSDPARADIACFVGLIATRPLALVREPRHYLRLRRAQLARAIRDLGWREGAELPDGERLVPPSVMPYGNGTGSFAGWLESLGWSPAANAVSPPDLFRRAAGQLLSDPIVDWWIENGWLTPASGRSAADMLELADVPVPIDTWDTFDALFAWDQRPGPLRSRFDTTLGAAVRRFFLQGGRKCYVVSVGDPTVTSAPLNEREPYRERLLRSFPRSAPADRSTWRGIAHLFGLPDVSFLCAPDLPELFAADRTETARAPEPHGEERFVECGVPAAAREERTAPHIAAPRCDEIGFREWSALVTRIGALLRTSTLREIQLVAAVPLATPEAESTGAQWQTAGSLQTAFVQLTYPWIRSRESQLLPGSVEPPDAMLVGMLANNALTSSTWRSIAREQVFGVTGLEPLLSRSELDEPLLYQDTLAGRRVQRTRRERISLFAPSPIGGFRLLSDVTTDDDEAYRPANVNRLVAALIRAARLTGEIAVFDNNGEALWRRLRSGLESLLLRLWSDGALSGATATDAFDVRCDRSTMTQADLDAGRLIARIEFSPANTLDRIVVVFAMDEGGQVSLAPVPREDTAGAPA